MRWQKLKQYMNQERVRERQGQFNGHDHNHAGQHSHLRRIDSAVSKIKDFLQGEPVVGGFHPEDHIPQDQEIVLFPQAQVESEGKITS